MRAFNYFIIMIGLAVMFEMAGFSVAPSVLTTVGLSTAGINTNAIYAITAVLLSAGLGAAIAVGFLTKSNTENYVILPFIVGSAFSFTAVFVGIINAAPVGWIKSLTIVIVGVPAIGFYIAMLEFFRGTD